MTLDEFRRATFDLPGDTDVEIYIPFEAVIGRKVEKGAITKQVSHMTTKLVEGIVILTTDVVSNKQFVKTGAEDEMLCDD